MADQTGEVRLTAYGVTNVGRVRTNNEDAYVIADLASTDGETVDWESERPVSARGALLAVSDGMGGAAAGEVASAMTVESLRQWLHEERKGVGTQKLFEGAVGEANRSVYVAAQAAERRGMGATLTAVLIRGSVAHIAEVGDSRAYLMRGGRIRQVTRDQSYVQLLVEQGLITRDQAERSPYRNVILQAMGQSPDVKVALGRLELRAGDRFLLCSDGLSGKVGDEEMRDVLALTGSIKDAADRLVSLANERGGEDNITVVIAMATGEGLASSAPEENITRTLSSVREFDLGSGSPTQSAVMPAPVVEERPTQVTTLLSVPAEAAPSEAARAPVASEPRARPWLWIAVAAVAVIVITVAIVLFAR